MKPIFAVVGLAFVLSLSGCGTAYQTGTRLREARMENWLKQGQSTIEVREKWGEPDILTADQEGEMTWSYAAKPNSSDLTAELLYTSAKAGDAGTFLDLHFTEGKLVSWEEQQHTMPSKTTTAFKYGFGVSSPHSLMNNNNTSHY